MAGDRRAVIIGGGIAGLTTTIALRQVGIDALTFDEAPELREVGAGLWLWANALSVFRELGLEPAVRRLGAAPFTSGIRSLDGRWLTRFPPDVVERRWGAPTIAVLRADLQELLLASLPRDHVGLNAPATELHQNEDAVTVSFQDGKKVVCDALVGADGLHSVVRGRLFGVHPPRYRGYAVWRGVSPGGPGIRDSSEYWGQGQRFGLIPGRDRLVIWYASANAPEGTADADGPAAALLQRFGTWPDPIPDVIAATPEHTIVKRDVHDRPLTRRWVVGRVALMGDAAHPLTPDLGQGACQAIVDAKAIADSLATTRDVGAALADYERRRRRSAAAATVSSRYLGAIGQLEHPLVCRVRNAALRATPLSLQLRRLDSVLRRR